jgi:hypothetical protein
LKSGATFPSDRFGTFRKAFKFKPYTYCYYCGSPQDHRSTYMAPTRHVDKYGRNPCLWSEFTFAVVFTLWHTEGVQEEMVTEFDGLREITTGFEFAQWCAEEHLEDGEYTKMLEVFLWYCEKRLGP